MIHTSISNHTPKITYIYQPTPQSHAYVYYNGFTYIYIYIYLFSMMINCTPCTPLNEVQNPSSTTNFVEISNYLDVSVQKNIPYFIQRKYVHIYIYIYINRCSKQKQKQTLNLYIYTNVHTHTTTSLIKKTFPKMVYTKHKKKKRRKEKKTMTITYLVFYRSYIILL